MKKAYKILVLINVAMLFLSGLNPARITSLISRNCSLFTCGTSWNTLVQNLGRAFDRGWVSTENIVFLFLSCMLMLAAGVFELLFVGMSLGNEKLKYMGFKCLLAGGVIKLLSCGGIFASYHMLLGSERIDKVEPISPNSLGIYLIFALIHIVVSVYWLVKTEKPGKDVPIKMAAEYRLLLMFTPIILLIFLFSYLPLYGWRYAFFNYKAGEELSLSNFAGFKWFIQLLQNEATRNDIVRVLKNTLAMSFLGLSTSWLPMVFAILLTQIKNERFKRFVQTFTTIPNFISWVLVYAIALAMFSTDGFVNTIVSNFTGSSYAVNHLMSDSYTWLKMLLWGLWKSLGWSAIVYIAAISGLDQQLFEAADIDGAGRFQKIRYITIPGLLPTYFVLLIMSIAGILSNGMDQYLVFSNAVNKDAIEVLDLYVYNLGIGSGAIPLSTVIGMVKSLVSVLLLLAANSFSKVVRGESVV